MKNYSLLLINLMLFLCAVNLQAQDEPASAVALTVGGTFEEFPAIGDNTNATASEDNDASIPIPGCGSYLGGDVWFTVEVPNGGNLIIETQGTTDGIDDTVMSVYEGGIGNFSEIGCDDDGGEFAYSYLLLMGRTPGEVLYIRVFEYANNEFGDFRIAARTETGDPDTNDDINNPIVLVVGNDFGQFAITSDNSDATASEIDDSSIPNPGCASYNGGDLWYTVEVPANGALNIETGGLDPGISDTGLSVYQGGLGNLSLLQCNDDGGEGNHSFINLENLTPGEILYVRAHEYGNDFFGEFQVSAYDAIAPEPAINDNPVDAIELTVGGIFDNYPQVGTNLDASDSEIFDASIPNANCGIYAGGDVWYTVEVPYTGDIRIETRQVIGSGLTDAVMTVQTGVSGSYEEIACEDDNGIGAHPLVVLDGLTPGEILTVRIYEYGNNSIGEFLVSAYSYGVIVDVDELLGTDFNIFPNPAMEQLNIDSDASIESIEVYDMLGRSVLVTAKNSANTQIDISSLTAGSYFIEINTSEGRGVSKFVKQ